MRTTLKFVAQSGHTWEETVDSEQVQSHVNQVVETHGDIERVEQLAHPQDMSGDVVWSQEVSR